MPFKSKKQETFLRINYPEIARKWVKESKRYNLSALGLEKYEKKKNKSDNKPQPAVMEAPEHHKAVRESVMHQEKSPKKVYKKLLDKKVLKKKNKAPLYKADDVERRDYKNMNSATGHTLTESDFFRNKKFNWGKPKKKKVSKKNNQTTRTRTLIKDGKNVDRNANLTGRRVYGPETYEDGVHKVKKRYEVDAPEGKRWYEGEGKSRDNSLANIKAEFDAEVKANLNPQDSVITGGKIPVFTPPKDTKKKKKKKDKKRFWQLKK